jgi:acyl-CoA dehydrogenase
MRRTYYNDDHETFRKTLRAFIETEVVPVFDEWFAAGQAPREFYYKLGELGVFGIEVPEEYGGAGEESFNNKAINYEAVAPARVAQGGRGVHVGR